MLAADRLAAICKDAADQCKIRLDDAKPGQLLFSVRSAVAPTKIHLMAFEVSLTSSEGSQHLTTRIVKYKTTQATVLFIPVGPKRIVGLSAYEKFMRRFSELIECADPDALVTIAGH